MSKKKQTMMVVGENGEMQIKCKKQGKDTYIYTEPGVCVYDAKHKRRIAKNGNVLIRLREWIVWKGNEYIVKDIGDEYVTLTKVG